ncbi:MAG TPA: hypothetical protein VG986_17550 [Pseudolabrys sp.]|nr:hypothetical protein [Pseudolabrys sp.]
MLRTLLALAVAGLIVTAVTGNARAAPIAAFPIGVTADAGATTLVSWRRCWRDRWGRLHCRRCWRNRWGRVRCW